MGRNLTYSEAIAEIREAVRQRFAELTPEQRGRAVRGCSSTKTHCYAWLRGDDHALSAEAIDELMQCAGIHLSARVSAQMPVRPMASRDEEVVRAVSRGETIGRVAERHGISPQRVSQIARRAGVAPSERQIRITLARLQRCAQCGGYWEVAQWRTGNAYCSPICRLASRSGSKWSNYDITTLTCATCGEDFEVTQMELERARYYGHERRYCSQRCYWDRNKSAV